MSNQKSGFSGVGNLSTPQDSLISPRVFAQTPTWNPLKHSQADARKAQWAQLKNQVDIDNFIVSQDNQVDQKISQLERQFVQRVNAGERLRNDHELFPYAKPKEQVDTTYKPVSSYTPPSRVDPLAKVHAVNWPAWAAAVCLLLIGLGSFGVWMFSGRPDVEGIIDKFTSDIRPTASQTAQSLSTSANKEHSGNNNQSASGDPVQASVVSNSSGVDFSGAASSGVDAAKSSAADAAAMLAMDDLYSDQEFSGINIGSGSQANVKENTIATVSDNQERVESSDNADDSAAEQALAFLDDGEDIQNSAISAPSSSANTAHNNSVDKSVAKDKAAADNTSASNERANSTTNAAAAALDMLEAADEQIYLSPISELTNDGLMKVKLSAMPKIKRPSEQVLDADKLSPEAYRWCALAKMGTTELSQIPKVCDSQNVLRYAQEVVPYLPYLKILGLYRAVVEQKRDPSDFNVQMDKAESVQWEKYQLTSEANAKALNERDTHHCGQSWTLINGYFAMSQFGFSAEALNKQIRHFNQICSGKTVPIEQQSKWMERDDLLLFVQLMMIVNVDELTQHWTNFTFLQPAQGTAAQRKPEIKEAQNLLKQLGYKIDSASGTMNDQTRNAIKEFEQDMCLQPKGDLTFSILLRLRLAMQGYDSQKAWSKPLKSPA